MKVLFGNCSHSEAPLIEKALSMGWRASSVGNDSEALLASSMTRFFKGDFALPDIYDSAVEELRPNWVIPAANDVSYRAL